MPTHVLLVEDNPGDVQLTQEAFRAANVYIQLHVVTDGVEAMKLLKREGTPTRASPRSYPAGSEPATNGRPRGPVPDQNECKPANDSSGDTDHFPGGNRYRQKLRTPCQLLPQQASRVGCVREPGEKHQRFLVDQGQATPAEAKRG